MEYVYLLQHSYQYGKNDEHDETKIIGAYSSKHLAEETIDRYVSIPGFKDYSAECFYIDMYKLDNGNWTEGFVDDTRE